MDSFPFLRLPQSVRHRIILKMSHFERLVLSVCSKKAKSTVKECKLSLQKVTLRFENRLQIEIVFDHRTSFKMVMMNEQHERPRSLDRPQTVQCFGDGNRFVEEWKGLPLGFSTWIHHLLTVYCGPKLILCAFAWQSDLYDIGSIKRALHGFQIRSIVYSHRLSEQNFRRLLNSEILSECVTISDDRYQDESDVRKLLSQNLLVFYCFDISPTYFSCLDNILPINCQTVYFERLSLSDKDLNRFLKLWKIGSMPRLEYMRISVGRNRIIDKNMVFKGVDHIVNEPNHVRQVEVKNTTGQLVIDVQGGYNVTRDDGVEATIKILHCCFLVYVLK